MLECIQHSLLNIKDMHNKLFFLLATPISMPLFAQTSKDIEPNSIECQDQVVQQKDTIHNEISEDQIILLTSIKLGLSDLPNQAPNCDMLEKH